MRAPSFDDATKEGCGQLLLPTMHWAQPLFWGLPGWLSPQPVLYWKDWKTSKEILPYRKGATLLNCDSLELANRRLREAAQLGFIDPTIAVHWRRLSLIITLPMLLFAVISYWIFGRQDAQHHASEQSAAPR